MDFSADAEITKGFGAGNSEQSGRHILKARGCHKPSAFSLG